MVMLLPDATQTAVANGDTRSISLYHAHRKDSLVVTFRKNGSYDRAALKQLNYFLRDWRNDEQIRMDPRLFDVIWEAQRMVGARGRITVLSSYRSPKTNSMLRRRTRGVAKNSQHMFGRAMDLRIAGANMHRVREAAMKLQRGGVGWYRSRFVHLDVGSVRAWPRMTYSQLSRLFPDGKTVHIASNGRTLPGYNEARSIVASRTGTYVPTQAQTQERGFLARLFGWGDSSDEADQRQARQVARRGPLGRSGGSSESDNSAAGFFRRDAARRRANVIRPKAAKPAPVKTAARVPAASAPVKPQPKPLVVDDQKPILAAPVPPRRPSQTKIATLIEKAAGLSEDSPIPVPPHRPDNLVVVAENSPSNSAPLPPDSRGRLAALIGLNSAGALGAKKGLPSVITQGTAVAANASAPDVLAFAALPGSGAGKRSVTNRRLRRAKIRRLALRRSLSSSGISRAIGVRAASQEKPESMLVAARFDRSNFHVLTRPGSLANGNVNVLMGSGLGALRTAARFSRDALVFAGQQQYQSQFVVVTKKTAWKFQRFSALR